MKKVFYLVALVLFCFSCNKTDKYIILGEIENVELENQLIGLFAVDSTGNASLLSSDSIKQFKFSFTGEAGAGLAYVELTGETELGKRYLLLEADTIRLLFGDEIKVTGTPANNDYQDALNSEIYLDEIEAQYEKEKENGTLTAETEEALNNEYDEQFKKTKETYTYFFKNNIHNLLGQKIFTESRWNRRLDEAQLDSVLSHAGDSFKATEVYQTSSERLHNMKTSVPGNPYKDIVSKRPDGSPVALSDYAGKGKYVLLDFWASWCPPCREEMPLLVKLYRKYQGKNFEIVAYSLDKTEEAWKKGIKSLGLTWPQMSDCAYWNALPVKSYAVQGIPCTILIDPEGKIIARDLRGEKLAETLEQLIK
ncbi:MAG: TlpA family protein disulfide reductase [Candidatus Symbiothrix sp.]|jgi:thiol-disulfide isomerase/thioredoxin|nr:TlpA family protein disulfide reductase [Candidatus Symbiothrix sp.]